MKVLKAISASDNRLNPTLSYHGTKIRVKFTGNCLNPQKITYNHGKVVNIYLVYELEKKLFIWFSYFNKKHRY